MRKPCSRGRPLFCLLSTRGSWSHAQATASRGIATSQPQICSNSSHQPATAQSRRCFHAAPLPQAPSLCTGPARAWVAKPVSGGILQARKKKKKKQIFLFLSAAGVHHTASQPQGKMSAVLEESKLLLAACSCRGEMGCFEGVFGGNIYMYLFFICIFFFWRGRSILCRAATAGESQ